MTAKEKKEYLSQAFRLDGYINSLLAEKEDLRHLKDKCFKCTVSYESDGSQHTSGGNSTETSYINYIDKLMEYEKELDDNIDKLIDIKRKIKQIIELVPNREQREILLKRYINFEKWEQIAVDMHFNMRWVLRLHSKALENIKISH